MRVTWKVSDGFVNNGTQSTTVDDSEIEACDDEAEAIAIVEAAIQDAFDQKVSWTYSEDRIREEIRRILANKQPEGEA